MEEVICQTLEELEQRAEVLAESGYEVFQNNQEFSRGVFSYTASKNGSTQNLKWLAFRKELRPLHVEFVEADEFLDELEKRLDNKVEPYNPGPALAGFVDFSKAEEGESEVFCISIDQMKNGPNSVKRLTQLLARLESKIDNGGT